MSDFSRMLATIVTAVTLTVLAAPARALDVDGLKIGLTSCTKAIHLAYGKSRDACGTFRYAENVEPKDRWSSPPEFCVKQVDEAERRALARFQASREGAECVPPGFRLNPFLRAAYGWASSVADEAPSTAAGECPYKPIFSELVFHPEEVVSVELACTGDRLGFYAQTIDESYPKLLAKLRARHGRPSKEWGTSRRLPLFAGGTSRQMNVLFSPKSGGQILLVNLATASRRLPLQEEGPEISEDELTFASDSQVLYFHESFLRVPRQNFAARAKRLSGASADALAAVPRRESPYKALTPVQSGASTR